MLRINPDKLRIMHIINLKINNFRGIKEAILDFEPGLNFLIGANNIGKSTILIAINYLLNPYIQWWRHEKLSEFDYWRRDTENEINIEGIICCGYTSCTGEDNSCPHFERGSEPIRTCKLSKFTLFYNKDNQEDPFPNIDDLEQSNNLELVIRVKMTGHYNEEENYVIADHYIFGNDGEWHNFTRSMKESIGTYLFTSIRDPNTNFRLQYNSLLIKLFKDINKTKSIVISSFREGLAPVLNEIYNNELSEFFEDHMEILQEFSFDTSINLGLGKIRDFDILRQIELGLEYSIEGSAFKIPLSFQGRGLQNLLFLFLCGKAQSQKFNMPLILLLEEPEQNLEPQRQRSIIQMIKKLVGNNTQIIITTHSPFILTRNLTLQGVQRLIRNNEGRLYSFPLSNIRVGRVGFSELRKKVNNEIDLFESLFSNFIVIWEGECELGFYPPIMRSIPNYPSEWLIGLDGGGDYILEIANWLKEANYEVIGILDGDKEETLASLIEKNIPFIALPSNLTIEDLVVESLEKLDNKLIGKILIKSIGTAGSFTYRNEIENSWELLKDIFRNLDPEMKQVKTEDVLREYENITGFSENSYSPNDLKYFLQPYKKRSIYETLSEELIENNAISDKIEKIIEILKQIFKGEKALNFYQFNEQFEI